ncbi:MAG: hypothetical protein V8Q23_01090 [Eubacteriales bacterium]
MHVRQDAEYDESKYRNGEQYLIHGKDTVTENGTTFDRYILSKMDKSTSGATVPQRTPIPSSIISW